MTDKTRARARALRRTATAAERLLWSALRDRRLGGYKFARQVPIGPFIADFVCRRHRLVIEVDGPSHDLTGAWDTRRSDDLRRRGYRVIRVGNEDVFGNLDGVCAYILAALRCAPSPGAARPPLPQGRGDVGAVDPRVPSPARGRGTG